MSARGPYRSHSPQFKLQLCTDIRSGKIGRREAHREYRVSANLVQLWLTQYDRGELGEFNRSLQHPLFPGGCDEAIQALFGSLYSRQVKFTRASAGLAAGTTSRFLASYCVRQDKRRCGCVCWGVGTGRSSMVSQRGRNGANTSGAVGKAAWRPVSDIFRARGHRTRTG